MSEWSGGYNVDLGYTYGYYREMAPNWMDFCAVVQGVAPPKGRWRYLELGCGQGVGLVVMAAANPGHDFLGIDFNPVHIAHARSLAAAAKLTNVRFEEADFIELARDWPREWGSFDYVTAHGIHSWLALEIRKALIGTMDRATSPGGLVYLSYNTLPGWLSTYPVQHLLRLWQTSEEMASIKAIDTGIARLKQLQEVKTGLTESLPGMRARIGQMADHSRPYLVQEYLHDSWHPCWFDQVAEELTQAKLTFVGTATIGDVYVPQVLSPERREILAQYQNPIVRQVMLDVLVNQSFRRDIFARGPRPLWTAEQRQQLGQYAFALIKRPKPDDLKFRLSAGEVTAKAELYGPIYDALESGPKTFSELLAQPSPVPRGWGDTLQAVALMLTAGHICLHAPVAEPAVADRLNRVIALAVADGAPYRHLLSGKTGQVLTVTDTDLLFLALTIQGGNEPLDAFASKAVDRLLLLGKGLVGNNQQLTTREAMLPRTIELAREFRTRTLSRLRELGAV